MRERDENIPPHRLSPDSGEDVQRMAERIAAQFGRALGVGAGAGPGAGAGEDAFEALRAFRDRLDDILQVVTDGVLVLDFTTAVVYANAPARALFGDRLVPGRALASSLDGLVVRGEDGALIPAAAFPALLPYAGERPADTLLCIDAGNPGERWAIVRCSPVLDEARRVLSVIAVLRDATEQKRSEARLRLLSDASALLNGSLRRGDVLEEIATFLTRRLADGCVIHLAEEGRLSARVVRTSDEGRTEALRALVHRWTTGPAVHGPAAVLRSRDPELHEPFDPALAELREDGEGFRPTSAIVAPLAVGNEVLGVLSLFTTRRPPLRPSDLVLVDDLSRRIAMAVENVRLYAELLAQNARKDEFIAVLGHELRNPLAPILSTLDLLSAEAPQATSRLQLMRRHARHLLRLVDDLLDVSRIGRGKVELRREAARLRDIVQQATESVAPLVAERGISLEQDLRDDPWLFADAARLAQALGNLLHNAARFTPRGGRIVLRAAVEEGAVVLRVSDTGCGFAPALAPRFFEPFVQGDGARTGRHAGLGLGLSLVRGFVELHGGTVEAKSPGPGLGSEFVIRLPKSLVVAPLERKENAAPGASVLEGARVLIVDDNRNAADLLARVLALRGASVRCAYEPFQALDVALEQRPTVLLLDIGLPEMSGHELARRLRETLGEEPLLLALSGYGQPEDRERSLEAGCDAHLVKPVELHALEEAVRQAAEARDRSDGPANRAK